MQITQKGAPSSNEYMYVAFLEGGEYLQIQIRIPSAFCIIITMISRYIYSYMIFLIDKKLYGDFKVTSYFRLDVEK